MLRSNDFDAMLLKRANAVAAATDADANSIAVSDDDKLKSIIGIGIDHYAAFIVEGDSYRVFSIKGKPGSVSVGGSSSDDDNDNDNGDDNDGEDNNGTEPRFAVEEDGTATGKPGVWIKRVVRRVADNGNGKFVVKATVCPPQGKLIDIISSLGDTDDDDDNYDDDDDYNRKELERCRRENPSIIL